MGILAPPAVGIVATRQQTPLAEEPASDHWRWRLRMAEQLAAQLDPKRFGVEAVYVFGSTKNASAGPGSDIDLLIHFTDCTPEQRASMTEWLEGWSLLLELR